MTDIARFLPELVQASFFPFPHKPTVCNIIRIHGTVVALNTRKANCALIHHIRISFNQLGDKKRNAASQPASYFFPLPAFDKPRLPQLGLAVPFPALSLGFATSSFSRKVTLSTNDSEGAG